MLHDPTHSIQFAIVLVDKTAIRISSLASWKPETLWHNSTSIKLIYPLKIMWQEFPRKKPIRCKTQRKSLCHTIVQVGETKWINGSDWWEMLECVSLCDIKQKFRKTQKIAYNPACEGRGQEKKNPDKECAVNMPWSGGLCSFELMSQTPVSLL